MDETKIKVLIVDDDPDLLKVCSSYLNFYNLNVVGTATNGFQAIEMVRDSITKPDVIVMDYHMPKINGIETSKEILKINSSYKILMISAYSSIKNEALSSGINEFLGKPFNFQNLAERIIRLARN
jgi:YesN/AraC family two-component response regulator